MEGVSVPSALDAAPLPTRQEIRLAAYRYAARITDAAWEPRTVISGIGEIEDWLTDHDSRDLFDLKCAVLDEITTNYGLVPPLRNPAHVVCTGQPITGDAGGPRMPTAPKLIAACEALLRWLTAKP